MIVLPNMRLLGLPSTEEGRDWVDLARKIDQKLESEGWDLSEETTLVEFRKGEVKVYRPIIGGVRELGGPWILTDRTSLRVESRVIEADYWEDILDEIDEEEFTVLLKRRYEGGLSLSVEVVFSFF